LVTSQQVKEEGKRNIYDADIEPIPFPANFLYNGSAMTSYRYPNEILILALTLFLVFAVIAVTAAATFCGSLLFVLVMLVISFLLNRSHHDELIQDAQPVTVQTAPELAVLTKSCATRLQAGSFSAYIAPGNILNAYTFGLGEAPVVVVYAGVLRIMDEDELSFIIGHELGHVCLGHTWLNSLVGGMSGIPSPYFAAVLLYISFRWWNRACEYSADRAGLLACGKPEKAASALIKLVGGTSGIRSLEGWQQALRRIESEDDHLEGNLQELLSSHPMIIRRLQALSQYATSAEYQHLQAQINRVASV
jgi:Zn-dependent protease with chaperone function